MTNKENNQQAITSTNKLEDLNIQETEAAEVKGGPIYMKFPDIDGEVHRNAPMQQTREHILLARQ